MSTKERIELAEWLLSYAKKKGADECEVNIFTSQAIDIEVFNRKINKIKEAIKNSISISLYANQRYSVQSTNNLDKESLQKLINETLDYTRYLAPDPHRVLIDPVLFLNQSKEDLNIYDPFYQNLAMKKRMNLAKELEDTALEKSDKIISVTSSFSDFKSESIKILSNGFFGLKESTLFSLSTEVTVNDKNKGRPEDYAFSSTRFFKDLPSPDRISTEAVKRALAKIGQKKIESGVYDMIVENRSAGRLLQYLINPLTGNSLQQKNSFLETSLLQKIASDKLTIVDHPFKSKGLGSRHFDSEGISARKRDIIKKGILKSFYIDNYYGKKLNRQPTSGSTSNLLVSSGEKPLSELIKTIKNGFLITDFIGGNANSATGDFSFGVIGRYIKKGEVQYPINEMNISGNFLTLLANLKDTANDVFKYSTWYSPSLYFSAVNFSGI